MKDLIISKSRYQRWEKFLIENNLLETFNKSKLYEDETYAETAHRLINDIKTLPMCKCGSFTKFKVNHYQEYCSISCQASYNSSKRLKTYNQKTGYTHPHKNPTVKEQMAYSSLIKYGEVHPMKSSECVKKLKSTKKIKYGDENYNNIEKTRETNLERYGYACILEDQDKKEDSIYKKYGQRNIMQTGLCEHGYKWKEYVLPSGKIIKIQGYENFLLDELLATYHEDDIKTSRKDMPEFWYLLDGKKRRYFPDVYVPIINTIYEVKSEYTLNKNKEMNKLKFESVEMSEYNFLLIVF